MTEATNQPPEPEEIILPAPESTPVNCTLAELEIFLPRLDKLVEIAAACQHASAEINTAIREGFYVQMGVPELEFTPSMQKTTDGAMRYGFEVSGIRFQYQIQKADPKREIHVDHRSEFEQHASPAYRAPNTDEGNPTSLSD